MGMSTFDVADSIVSKLINNESINLEAEVRDMYMGEVNFLCGEIKHRLKVWYLQESGKYTEPDVETMTAKMNFIGHAINVFNEGDNICSALMSM